MILMNDIAVVLENKPGSLASLGETLGKENINIEGICGAICDGEDLIHLLVEEAGKAYNVLEQAGFQIKELREVIVLEIKEIVSQPGAGGQLFRKIAQENINIDIIYLAENNRIVLGVDNIKKVKEILL